MAGYYSHAGNQSPIRLMAWTTRVRSFTYKCSPHTAVKCGLGLLRGSRGLDELEIP
jgi:hypothetical protein